eukprot:2641835-Prymnesium_polylepis.1
MAAARAHGRRPHVGPPASTKGRTRTLPRLNRAMEDTCSTAPTHLDHPTRVRGRGSRSVKT